MSSQNLRLVGNVGKDAEAYQFPNGQFAISFPVAVTEKWKTKEGEKKEKTTWFKCTYYRPSDKLAPFIKKGNLIEVQGKPSATAYEKSGVLHTSLECIVSEIDFLYSNNNSSSNVPPQPTDGPTPFKEEEEDDLPF